VALHRNPARAHGRRHRHRAVLLLVCVLAAGRLLADQHRQEMPAPAVLQALELEGDPESGARAYEACAVCHLPSGAGRSDGTFPQLAGQHRSVIIKQLVDIRDGRRSNNGSGAGTDLARGERLYRSDCQECHGVRGEGDAERFVPVLSGQHYSYLLRQVRAIAGGRRGNASRSMERHARPYSDAELQAVVDFASRLDATRREERH
jgi:cytochrome c553